MTDPKVQARKPRRAKRAAPDTTTYPASRDSRHSTFEVRETPGDAAPIVLERPGTREV